jgi:hypothetical protein
MTLLISGFPRLLSPEGYINDIPDDGLLAEQAIKDAGGFPLFDAGETLNYKGLMTLRKVTNTVSSRYVLDAASVLGVANSPNLTNPESYGWQTLGKITIPGGALVGKGTAVVDFVLECLAMFGTNAHYIFADIEVAGDGGVGNFFTRPVANATRLNSSFTLTGKDSSTLTLSGGGWYSYTGGFSKRCNLMKEITIVFKFAAASNFGRAVSFVSGKADLKDTVTLPQSGVLYRDPIQQPFKANSFWNVPLGDGATFQQATDPETASILTGNPGGVSNGAFPWISGKDGGGNNFIQLKSTDPVSNFSYGSRAYGGPWPFAHTDTGGASGTFRMRAPAQEFITAQSSDRVITLITPDKRYMLESGEYSYNAANNTHKLGYCTVWDLYGTGLSNNITTGQPLMSEGYRASGHPLCGGIIRVSDMEKGSIDHVIAMQLSQWQQRAGVFSVVSAVIGGMAFSVKPLDAQQKSQSYAPLLKAGKVVGYAGKDYILAADATYDATNNTTNFTVTTAIASSSGTLYLGGANKNTQQANQLVWPATYIDNYSLDHGQWGCYRGLVPMGAMFGIPPNVDVTTLGLTPEGLMLARAFQKYGGVNNDTTNNTFSICFLETGMSATQKDNLNKDRVILRNQLRMITNISAANPGGPGNRLITPPQDLYPFY